MKCPTCFAVVSGEYCQCGEKMIKPIYAKTTIELKNNGGESPGEPAYFRHMDAERAAQHKNWMNNSIQRTIHLSKKEKSSFWMNNLRLALNGGLKCQI